MLLFNGQAAGMRTGTQKTMIQRCASGNWYISRGSSKKGSQETNTWNATTFLCNHNQFHIATITKGNKKPLDIRITTSSNNNHHRNTETTNCNAVEGQVAMHVLKGFSPQNQNKLNEMEKKRTNMNSSWYG